MSEKIMVTTMLAFTLVCLNVKAERKVLVPSRESAAVSIKTSTREANAASPLDTLPEGRITIRTNRDGKRIEAKLLDRKIQELMVDGKEVPAAEYNNYEKTINEIIASVPPPPPPPSFPLMAPDAPSLPPGIPGDVPPPPRAPGPGKFKFDAPAPPPPSKGGYYYYNKGDDQIIIEMPKTDFKYNFNFNDDDKSSFSWKGDGLPFGIDRAIMIDGLDSIEVARFREPFSKFKSFGHFNMKLDSMKIKLDTTQMRRLKMELGNMGNLNMELNEKLKRLGFPFDERQFFGDEHGGKIDPGFNFKMRTPGPGGMKRFGNTKDRIEQTLVSDELVKAESHYTFELTGKYLKIDGKKMPDTLFEKYRKLYEESTGIKLESESKIVLSN